MKAVILAAGFATRLYPLTRNFPKPLLEIGGMPLIDHLLEKLAAVPLTSTAVVCNRRFEAEFRRWCPPHVDLVVNDAMSDDARLGAVGDLGLALSAGPGEDVLVAAADNLFDFSLAGFVQHFAATQISTVCVWHNADETDRRRRGNAVVGAGDELVSFAEKPATPASAWSSAPLYAYSRDDAGRVHDYLREGGNPDAPGHFVAWLCQRRPMQVYRLADPPLDIGNHESLAAARARLGD